MAAALLALTAAAPLAAATLTLPDGSVLTLPPGAEGFGPMDHLPEPGAPPEGRQPFDIPLLPPPDEAPPTRQAVPGERAAREPAPEAPSPGATDPAERKRARIDALFARLAGAQDAKEAESLTDSLDRLWLQSGSPTADLLMSRATAAVLADKRETALALLDKLVVLRPDWAEAWNKRATVRYLANDDVGSMADIGEVLRLEPRHFGALGGMGFILHRNGDDKGALAVLRRALEIDPQQPEVKALVDTLATEVEGQPL